MSKEKTNNEQHPPVRDPASLGTDSFENANMDPISRRWQPDWWRCWRLGPVSGRYEGEISTPKSAKSFLDLRVDIDPRGTNSPAVDKISGDFYRVYHFEWFGRKFTWRVYLESWIVDVPKVKWERCQVEIQGNVRYWKGTHLKTGVFVRIPWGSFRAAGPAEAIFTTAGKSSTYRCTRKSDCFRDMTMEIDVCNSVNAAPILPSYDTHSHSTRPTDLPQRTLTIETAYHEAGIGVSIRPDRTIIDDSAAEFDRWTVAELHDAMETHFSQHGGSWPKWQMWGLLAGTFDDSPGHETGGIMFDAAAMYGGAGDAPDRQGFAVFRNHSWFNHLAAGVPATQAQAWAMRQFVYTWVHEAGHAFNFLHSWNKGRPDSLSWMNYPQYVTDFWDDFRFKFDTEELIHLRHGDRASVIMGGDAWASGGHIESTSGIFLQTEGEAPIEFLLRSQEFFEFMEPVVIELRLRNVLDDLPLELDTRLDPADGCVAIHIRRPDGRIVNFSPILCKTGTPRIRSLKQSQGIVQGEDRHSEEVFLGFGANGFYFDEPGDYLVQAIYQANGSALIPSNTHRIRVGRPFSKEEDRISQDYFSHEVGMSLYLNGSRSPFLEKGMRLLEEIANRFKKARLGASAATIVANSLTRPFFRVEDPKKPVLKKTSAAEPEQALALTAPALSYYHRGKTQAFNISHHKLVRKRVECLLQLGQEKEAKAELSTLRKDLAKRGVNEPVLNGIKDFEKTL